MVIHAQTEQMTTDSKHLTHYQVKLPWLSAPEKSLKIVEDSSRLLAHLQELVLSNFENCFSKSHVPINFAVIFEAYFAIIFNFNWLKLAIVFSF